MALIEKIREAHREGILRYGHTRRLLSSPVYLLATAVERVVPGTVEDLSSKPDPLKPLAMYYQPQVAYLKRFCATLTR